MGSSTKAFVSCELAGEIMRTEVKGDLENILSLATYLMVSVATNTAEAGIIGLDNPKEIIVAMCEAATEALDVKGGSRK